jgi:hypothetical protein
MCIGDEEDEASLFIVVDMVFVKATWRSTIQNFVEVHFPTSERLEVHEVHLAAPSLTSTSTASACSARN